MVCGCGLLVLVLLGGISSCIVCSTYLVCICVLFLFFLFLVFSFLSFFFLLQSFVKIDLHRPSSCDARLYPLFLDVGPIFNFKFFKTIFQLLC